MCYNSLAITRFDNVISFLKKFLMIRFRNADVRLHSYISEINRKFMEDMINMFKYYCGPVKVKITFLIVFITKLH